MAFFLRFTNSAKEDLERGTSLHLSDFSKEDISIADLAEMFDCDEDDIVEFNGRLCQQLDGICGYELEATTIEEAIEEVNEGVFQFSDSGKAVIYRGVESSQTNLVPDGDLFYPLSIEITL